MKTKARPPNFPMRQILLAQNILDLLRGLCWRGEDSDYSIEPTPDYLRISFTPHPEDFHLCMGKGGCVIKGLQFVASSIGNRNDYKVSIRLLQEHKEEAARGLHEFKRDPNFNPEDIIRIAGGLLSSALGREVKLRTNHKPDRLDIKAEIVSPEVSPVEAQVVDAISQAVYAYGWRQGCICKLMTTEGEKAAA